MTIIHSPMSSHGRRRNLALILALAAPWLLSAYDLNLMARFLALSLTAMGLVLLWGEGGILSLGQGVFFGLGGYAIAMHLQARRTRQRASCPISWSGPGLERRCLGGGRCSRARSWRSLMVLVVAPPQSPTLFGWAIFRAASAASISR